MLQPQQAEVVLLSCLTVRMASRERAHPNPRDDASKVGANSVHAKVLNGSGSVDNEVGGVTLLLQWADGPCQP